MAQRFHPLISSHEVITLIPFHWPVKCSGCIVLQWTEIFHHFLGSVCKFYVSIVLPVDFCICGRPIVYAGSTRENCVRMINQIIKDRKRHFSLWSMPSLGLDFYFEINNISTLELISRYCVITDRPIVLIACLFIEILFVLFCYFI